MTSPLWHRIPPGRVMQGILARRQMMSPVKFRRDLLSLSEAEFEELLRAERVSDKMVQAELVKFRELKAMHDAKALIQERRQRRLDRDIGEDLDVYVEAEIRRIAGSEADAIIQEMRDEAS